jgi:hypothetical protein
MAIREKNSLASERLKKKKKRGIWETWLPELTLETVLN